MKPRAHLVAVLATLTIFILAAPLAASGRLDSRIGARAHGSHVVGYFIQWGIYGRNYKVKDVKTSGSAERLTDINYAFGNVAPDSNGDVVCKLGDEWADYQRPWTAEESVTGEEVTWPRPILGNFQQLRALKQQYPQVKVLISLGGSYLVGVLLGRGAGRSSRGSALSRPVSTCSSRATFPGIPVGEGWAARAPPLASSTGLTSTGSGRAPKGIPATSFARRTSRITSCCSRSSASSSTRTASRPAGTIC